MKSKLVPLFVLGVVVILSLLYFIYPKNEFTERDDVLLRQISFLINADICIRDFEKNESRIPKDIKELIENYPSLLAMRESFEHEARDVLYQNHAGDGVRIKISNTRPRVDLELRTSGKITKIQ